MTQRRPRKKKVVDEEDGIHVAINPSRTSPEVVDHGPVVTPTEGV